MLQLLTSADEVILGVDDGRVMADKKASSSARLSEKTSSPIVRCGDNKETTDNNSQQILIRDDKHL